MIRLSKPTFGEQEKEAVCKVIDSGLIVSGAEVTEFERAFAAYIGVRHGIGTSSGTTALEVAFRALGIGAGDKVLTTPFSFIASSNSILYVGASPVYADVDVNTFNIDPNKAEDALKSTPGIKAILVVHLFGRCCDMDAFNALARKYNIHLVEDCAQSHGSEWHGRKAGSWGKISCFSFYPTKNLATGEGGMIMTDNDELAKKCRLLINHGMEVKYYHDIIGYNYRMTNIAGAIGLCQLNKLPAMNINRRKAALYYDENIQNELIVTPAHDEGHIYHQYTLRVKNGLRDIFLKYLSSNDIGYGVFYPITIPKQKCYASFNFPKDYLSADLLTEQVVSIPVHPSLTDDEIRTVAAAVNAFNGQ